MKIGGVAVVMLFDFSLEKLQMAILEVLPWFESAQIYVPATTRLASAEKYLILINKRDKKAESDLIRDDIVLLQNICLQTQYTGLLLLIQCLNDKCIDNRRSSATESFKSFIGYDQFRSCLLYTSRCV